MNRSHHPVDMLIDVRSELYVAEALIRSAIDTVTEVGDFPGYGRVMALHLALEQKLAEAVLSCQGYIERLPDQREAA